VVLPDHDRRQLGLVVQANLAEPLRERCRDAGVNDDLAKPVQRKVLEQTLAQWLGADAVRPDTLP
jgi:CheY-like chemotaxis protein